MMRSFTTGVLGIKANQVQMDVISNNIANVNTTGFKKSSVSFKDILSQSLGHSQGPSANLGGVNGMQIGLGVATASITSDFTNGTTQSTGRDIDMSIAGDGFFITTDGIKQYYTRSGAMDIDSQMNLINSGSATKVVGWTATEDPTTRQLTVDTNSKTTAINFSNYQKLPASSTSFVDFASNLQSSSAERSLPAERTLTFYDDQGVLQQLNFKFEKIDANNWSWTAYDDTQGQVGKGGLTFDNSGKLTGATGGPIIYDPDGPTGTPASLQLQSNNSAGITGAEIKPLVAETWAMSTAFSKNGVLVASDTVKLSEIYNSTGDAATSFDMRNISGDETLVFSGVDGNGAAVSGKEMKIDQNTTIGDVLNFIKTSFPNSNPTFNTQTGKIEISDASAGTKSVLKDIKINVINPDDAVAGKNIKFPGITTTTSANSAMASGFAQSAAGAGTVKSGAHSITVSKVSATSSNVTGVTTGLTRFTTFADLDIGNVNNFKISIDGKQTIQVTGLNAGTYAQLASNNTVSAPPAGGQAGSMTINGYQVSWTAAETAGLTQTQMGNLLANKINEKFRSVYNTDSTNPDSVSANFDTATNKLILNQIHKGAKNKITVQSADSLTGFDSTQLPSYGTDGSTISDLIDSINNQVSGVTAEMQGDRLMIKRNLTGSQYSVAIIPDASATTGTGFPAAPANITDPPIAMTATTRSIAEKVFGSSSPQTTAGTEESYNLTDVFTPAGGGTSTEIKYTNVKDGQIIGNTDIGQIILKASNLQAGTATITTTGETDAGKVQINTPAVDPQNPYNASFVLSSGGTNSTTATVQINSGAIHTVPMTVYDNTGTAHTINMKFEKIQGNKWEYRNVMDSNDALVQDYFSKNPIQGSVPTTAELEKASDAILGNRSGVLIFKDGKIDQNATATANGVILPDLAKSISFTPKDSTKVSFKPNFNLVTQYDSSFSTAVKNSNGNAMGKLSGFEVDSAGVIKGVYSNSQKVTIAQLATAKFVNNEGLEKLGNNLYASSGNSGSAQIGVADTGGRGSIQSQTLEMSNVDLAEEFTDMMIAQRAFQANSKSITTADQLLQEIIALRR